MTMNKDYYKPYEGRDIQILDQHAANTIAEDHLTFPYQLLDHLAHVLMLKEQEIISPEDAAQILRAVLKLRREGPDIVPRKHGLGEVLHRGQAAGADGGHHLPDGDAAGAGGGA